MTKMKTMVQEALPPHCTLVRTRGGWLAVCATHAPGLHRYTRAHPHPSCVAELEPFTEEVVELPAEEG